MRDLILRAQGVVEADAYIGYFPDVGGGELLRGLVLPVTIEKVR